MNGMILKSVAGALILGLAFFGPGVSTALGRLVDVDPVLHAAVEAMVANDREIQSIPELGDICRQVAEATVHDPRERSLVTQEVVKMRQEGVDPGSVIPEGVGPAARQKFAEWQGQTSEALRQLAPNDPKRLEWELMFREGSLQMKAFAEGKSYTPSPDMIKHAETRFDEWQKDVIARGIMDPKIVDFAKLEFTRWTSGEPMGPMDRMTTRQQYDTGAAKQFAKELGLQGADLNNPDTLRKLMADRTVTPEMLKKLYEGGDERLRSSIRTSGGTPGFSFGGGDGGWGGPPGDPRGMANMPQNVYYRDGQLVVRGPDGTSKPLTPEQQRAHYEAMRTSTGSGGTGGYGPNPATGGWEPGMGRMAPTGGPMPMSQADMEAMRTSPGSGMPAYGGGGWSSGGTDLSAGGDTTTRYTDWFAGGGTYGVGTSGTTYIQNYENHNYNNAQEDHCTGLTAAERAEHEAHGHCKN